MYEEEQPEPAPLVSTVPIESSSPAAAVTPSSPSPRDDYHQYQQLLHRVPNRLQILLEEIQDPQDQLLDFFATSRKDRVATPLTRPY